MLRYGVVQKEEYYTSPLRSHLTRYLGMHSGELLEPGVVRTIFRPGSMFLLCSDGVCGSLTDEEMLASIREERTAEHLVRKALTAGSRDNVTVILVWTD
jgi:protein phosphatase